jgi:hypothetical protein
VASGQPQCVSIAQELPQMLGSLITSRKPLTTSVVMPRTYARDFPL